ncbi:MAG: RdgB/HAM1 family non-canonical purine NTP pyrophosphatase [Bacteroidota bacterium]|nr:RdgB/HAM1 family non-canonical purine NTP pyrophosphatase [Bacteroidota bacterium]
MKICIASNNPHKVQEIKSILNNRFEIISLEGINCTDELPETQKTLEGNSLQKAEYIFKKFKVNALADDTGLEVVSLDGAPGVDSAMYAGNHRNNEGNISLLLKNLEGKTNRKAQFRTIISLIINGRTKQFEGVVKGEIIKEKRGNQGFGYDAIFMPSGCQKTFGEMGEEEKNKISHRGIAIRKLAQYLNGLEK